MKKKKKSHSEINFWQSNTDLMTGLALVLMLIIMLLILYLTQIPEDSLPDAETGDSYNVDSEIGDETDEAYRYPEDEEDGGGSETEEEENENNEADSGGGGGGEENPEEQEDEGEYPYPASSGEDWSKAAVYTTVTDGETGRAIREAGITFELYEEQVPGDGGALRFLNTYYPEKIEYQNYETTEEGVFYLPEKIEEGNYYFKQITDVEGYDAATAVHFTVDDVYDWGDPYVVSVEIFPSKNIIPVSLVDAETQEAITDGTFSVVAAEDISTKDGSIRYAKGTQADTISVGEDGQGESKELYLGQYTVSQETIPRYYASIDYSTDTEVSKKDGETPETLQFTCEKTKIKLQLTDELYTNLKLTGGQFTLTCETNPELNQTAATDENGEILFTDLEKNKTYMLRQTSAPENYKFDDSPIEIYVSSDGRIEGEAQVTYNLTNYITRMNIDVQDAIFSKPVSNVGIALYNSEDQLIKSWTSSGAAETFEDLQEGSYYVVINGKNDRKYEFEFTANKSLQEFSVRVWTMQNIITVIAGGAVILFAVFAVRMLIKKKKSSKSE